MITHSQRSALFTATARYHRAKAEFDHLDQVSRTRALTDLESRQMERAMKRMDEWGVAS